LLQQADWARSTRRLLRWCASTALP
jgi:hypothetical protein